MAATIAKTDERMKRMNAKEAYRMEAIIEAEASTGPLGIYSPVRVVECPHCGGRMQAMDAKVHVRSSVEKVGR